MKVFAMLGSALTKDEALGLARGVEDLPPNPVIVNIGAWHGTSTVAMLETRPDAFIFSVDVKPWPLERENLIKYGLDHRRVVRILGNSAEIDWPFDIDAIYIDGDHREAGIKADCEAWLHKVKPGGMIMFHDYIPLRPPKKNQVAKVVDSFFKDQKPEYRAGRVIVFRKGKQ